MIKKVKKAYLLCEPESGKVLSVISKKTKPGVTKSDPGLITRQCQGVAHAIAWLQAEIEKSGKLNLSIPSKYAGSTRVGQFGVEYRLEIYNRDLSLPAAEWICYMSGSLVDKLIMHSSAFSRCIVRNYEYTICAFNEIPVDEVRDSEAFTRNLEDKVFREKYGIFCITENYTPEDIAADYGIIFFDVKRFMSTLGAK